jgi:hypothetical protein
MLRWMLLGTAVLAFGSAFAADLPPSGNGIYGKAPRHARLAPVRPASDLLFTPSNGAFPEIHIPPYTPILLGSMTLPGYYGSNHSFEYQGAYYGGPNLGYRYRLPYACDVLGYYCAP